MPIFIPIMILLKFSGEGEIFYLQKRTGFAGKEFNLLKFATMLKDSPNLGSGDITLENDPRVLPVGRFLRITKINELPQLLNVFMGDMSLIGPRPLTKKMFLMYKPATQKIIVTVRPGLSGVGSIVFRNEQAYIKNINQPEKFYLEKIANYKGSLEEWFVANRSVALYLYLIIMTIYVIFTNKNNLLWRVYPTIPKSKMLGIPNS
jgi:lipopolysaccharide/colanic/teichoic acid biosynthesis glycosyltransferase